MKRFALALTFALPFAATAATWENAPLVDHMCLEKVKSSPDDHKTSCLVQCAGSGFGILDNGKWLKFDKAGNDMALAALKATTKKDHIRVNVSGDLAGDVIHVSKVAIP